MKIEDLKDYCSVDDKINSVRMVGGSKFYQFIVEVKGECMSIEEANNFINNIKKIPLYQLDD
ncbi:MAG: hypothetical protein HRU26_00875 [Psychroserpens sp.]|nr:hypothetical protein [Psychroserpens sp.]